MNQATETSHHEDDGPFCLQTFQDSVLFVGSILPTDCLDY